MAEKVVYVDFNYCLRTSCYLRTVAEKKKCKGGCWTGTLDDCTICKRKDNMYEQLSIYDFLDK